MPCIPKLWATMCPGCRYTVRRRGARDFALKLGNCQKCEFYKSGHYDKTYGKGQKDPLAQAT